IIVMGTRFSFGVFYISILEETGWPRAATAGIFSVSMVTYAVVSQALHGRQFNSFRIAARRAFKELPFGSREMNYTIGEHVMA
ncbi:hypothetical protein C2W62_53985, partial [Candidatus Entotheonella serta]